MMYVFMLPPPPPPTFEEGETYCFAYVGMLARMLVCRYVDLLQLVQPIS